MKALFLAAAITATTCSLADAETRTQTAPEPRVRIVEERVPSVAGAITVAILTLALFVAVVR